MTIKRIDPMTVAYPEPNDNGATRHLTLCRVETDDGTVGWGEAVTMWPAAARATEHLISGFADVLLGEKAVDNVRLWHDMRRHAWWYGHGGGLASFAISALDIALWDIRGKQTGQSLIEMLGGARRPRLPVIASTHAFRASLDEEIAVHAAHVAGGFAGVKVGLGKRGEARLGYELARDVSFVAGLREAIGDAPWIMLDRGQSLSWDLEHAVRLTRALEVYGLRWMEEPFEPFEDQNYRDYRGRVSTMVGAGEREWDERGYRRLIDSGAVDVVGFDPGRAQGITGGMKVIDLVEAAGLWFNAHAWSSAIVTAASVALSSSTDRALLFELKPVENPMQHELVGRPIDHEGGWVSAPSAPGLGIDIDEDVVRRYRLDH